jgi:pimeloyl-ACP methyl ester carboxylesterase
MAMFEKTFKGLDSRGFHQIAYTDWGNEANAKVAICVHGLTRNGRDFDDLAKNLASDYRVICPDVAGRGKSDYLPDSNDYSLPVYLSDMCALIARTGVEKIDWIGTSMGGLFGMILAAQPQTPIRRLVLNDIGPSLPQSGLARINSGVTARSVFPTFDDLLEYVKQTSNIGTLSEEQWRRRTIHYAKALPQGGYTFAFDPKITEVFHKFMEAKTDLWAVWNAIKCPTLVLRGTESDILLAETAKQMQERGPKAKVVEFKGVGHAPALMDTEQIGIIKKFLLGD